jgi:aryl-alcohol dehydrogenase-like predicted oxidoreductase
VRIEIGEGRMDDRVTRREFVKKAATAASMGLAGLAGLEQQAAEAMKPKDRTTLPSLEEDGAPPATQTRRTGGTMPARVLGRIGRRVSLLGLGMAPLGLGGISPAEAAGVVNEAIDLGVTYIDVASNYNDAEVKLAPVLRRRRSELFLVTKVEAQEKNGVLEQIRASLRRMQTDHVDAVHLHNLGEFDLKRALGSPDGAMAGLKAAKAAGYVRYFGISGHMRPGKFVEALDTGEIDLMMVAMNFVDRFTYNFEGTVLPAAQRHRTAVAAMKVLGGAVGMQYNPPQPALLAGPHYRNAIRYALSLPGVSTLVIGVKDRDELRQAVSTVQSATPLSAQEQELLLTRGRELAARWGAHFGPVS